MEETADLSQGEVWTDGPQAYRQVEYDHKIVIHDETLSRQKETTSTKSSAYFSLSSHAMEFDGLSKLLGAGRSHIRHRPLSEPRRRIVQILPRLPCYSGFRSPI